MIFGERIDEADSGFVQCGLGNGDIDKALTIKAAKFTKSAAEKITAAGGTAEVI